LNPERTKIAIVGLRHLIKTMHNGCVANVKDYGKWSRERDIEIADCLGYARTDRMPPAHLLVKPFFHPKLPLVGLNYGNAQQLLRGHPQGWTDALRYCRGTIFEWTSDLIALPYAKFFNLFNHEHPEADRPPDGPFEATVKLDGHLGIVFHYADKWHLTTHGSFVSRSAKLGQEMLDKQILRSKVPHWENANLFTLTLLVEIIHPSTRIRCDYNGHQGLVLTGVTNRTEFRDCGYAEIAAYGESFFDLHVTDVWRDFTLEELRREVAEQKPKNREGFVIRFADGMRGKLKYKHYLDRMSDQNLSYNALMHSSIDGTLKSKMEKMPEELWAYADDMWKKLEKARRLSDEKKAREYLYGLVPPDKSSQYYRKLCRDFLAKK